MDIDNLASPIPETTSETTPEITAEQRQPAKPKPSPSSLPDQSSWDAQDHESFEVILRSWTSEFGKMSPSMVEKMIRLWNLYPEEEMHLYAWRQMAQAKERRNVRPNLAYYEKCLETEARANWVVLEEGGNGHDR